MPAIATDIDNVNVFMLQELSWICFQTFITNIKIDKRSYYKSKDNIFCLLSSKLRDKDIFMAVCIKIGKLS